MRPFREILEQAEARHGAAGVAGRLPVPKTADELRAVPDDRYLSLMSLRIFRAGLSHRMVDAKWPAFEEVFLGFEPRRVRAMSDEDLDALLADARLIRNGRKIHAVRDNAAALCALAEGTGGFGAYLADWPTGETIALWDDIAKRFGQMGGNSGPMFLRMAGRDTFVFSPDVVRALNHWGVLEGEPKGKAKRAAAEAAFNHWAAETGRPLCQLSMTLALSVD